MSSWSLVHFHPNELPIGDATYKVCRHCFPDLKDEVLADLGEKLKATC